VIAAGTAAGELGVKMLKEREIQIEYCRLVAEAKEKRRESAARGGSAAAGGGCAGAAGSAKRPRTFVVTKEVQGAIGNALAVLKMLLAAAGGAERVFEFRCRAKAFRGRLDGEDQVVAVDGSFAGGRFPSLCVWAKACREELTGKV